MKLENAVVIVADLGELKVFNVKKSEGMVGKELKTSFSLEVINNLEYIDAHQKEQDRVSDSAGNFAGASGEEHNREIERKKRSINDIANDIDSIVGNEKPKALYLAFPKDTISKLTDALSQDTKTILTKTVASNLVKTDKNKILSHFE